MVHDPIRKTLVMAAAILPLLAMVATAEESKGPRIDIGGIDGTGGTIKGVVKFSGKPYKRKPVDVDADRQCAKMHKDVPLLNERSVVNEDGTLQNVFVFVSKGLEGKSFDVPDKPAILDQIGCRYIPHVSGIVAKQTLEIRNSDATTHNVQRKSKKNGKDNAGMAKGSKPLNQVLKKPEMGVKYSCQVHTWMGAYVHVMSHPFFAVTQEKGTFEIRGLPAGEYELTVWHEHKKYKPVEKTATVTVSEGGPAEVEFTFKKKKKKKKKKKS
ncbi:MAG: hypothetical protein CMJ18_26055 [Phycisphaeraceae bacterium]|nr:hypothetical protein [Phycisphaeraceae bacterium]